MSDDAGRFKAVLGALVKEATRHLPYALLYPCKVLKDWGDMHLDLMPLAPYSEILPPLTRIPLRLTTPGLTVKIKVGAVVYLAFGAAEADAPFCWCFDSGAVEMLEWRASTGARIVIDEGRGATSDDGEGTPPKTSIAIVHPRGQSASLDSDGGLTIKAEPGQTIHLDAAGNVTIAAPGNITLAAGGMINLAGGGPPVARVGDKVAGGIIITGSPKVNSG